MEIKTDRDFSRTKIVVTYGGALIGFDFGIPSITDIAVQSMRHCRWAGALRMWWPVGLHMELVADVCVRVLDCKAGEVHGLLHDAAEAIYCDVPGPLKAPEHRAHERDLLDRIYQSVGLAKPTHEIDTLVHLADTLALIAEAKEMGHPASVPILESRLQRGTAQQEDVEATQALLCRMLAHFEPLEALNAEGRHVTEYRDRLFREVFPKGIN